jgi:hypothetical protein
MGTMAIVCCGPDSCVQREKERSVMLYKQVKRRMAGCGALLPMSMWIDKILGVSHLLHEALLGMRAILFLAES